MTPARLDEITALADAATPGPWEVRLAHQRKTGQLAMAYFIRPPKSGSNIDNVKSWLLDEIPDLEFIAAARTAVPELIAAVTRCSKAYTAEHKRAVRAEFDNRLLRAEVERLRDQLAAQAPPPAHPREDLPAWHPSAARDGEA
jgi:hypothetical protein